MGPHSVSVFFLRRISSSLICLNLETVATSITTDVIILRENSSRDVPIPTPIAKELAAENYDFFSIMYYNYYAYTFQGQHKTKTST